MDFEADVFADLSQGRVITQVAVNRLQMDFEAGPEGVKRSAFWRSAMRLPLGAVFVLVLTATQARAEVVALEVLKREPYAKGKSFGDTGPYEKIAGVARFAIDPKNARNRAIVDLDLAPRNKGGKVEFAADFFILTPKDPAKGNGAIFHDVNNRGNKMALRMFNFALGANNVDLPGSAGDGFLFRRGYTVV